jgi:hypothetical protein
VSSSAARLHLEWPRAVASPAARAAVVRAELGISVRARCRGEEKHPAGDVVLAVVLGQGGAYLAAGLLLDGLYEFVAGGAPEGAAEIVDDLALTRLLERLFDAKSSTLE